MAQLPGSPRYVQYTASEGQITFSYSFKIYEDDEIIVQQDDTTLVLTTEYTVTGAGEESGGTIVLVTGATSGDIITLTANTMIERGTEFTDGGDFEANAINGEYNRLDNITSELLTQQGQTVRFDPIQESLDPTLSALTANRCIVVNSAGDGLEMSTYDPDAAQTEAAVSAAAAAASAVEASDYADDASGYATAALGYSNDASGYADDAAASAAEAAASAASIDLDDLESDIIPATDSTYDLGSTTQRFAETYTDALDVTNNVTIGGDITVNTDKFTVDGTNGNTVIDGTLTVSGETVAGSAWAEFRHQVAYDSYGGASTAGSWQTRTVDTEVYDDIGITLSTSQLTMPAGDYYCWIHSTHKNVGTVKIRLYDTTNTAVLIDGPSELFSATEHSVPMQGQFTITNDDDVMELQYYVTSALATSGLGDRNNVAAMGDNVYASILIKKVG